MLSSPAPLTQALALARKDLRLERRTGETFLVTAPFGAVALMMVPLAVGPDTPLLRQLGPALFWVVVLLFGVLATMRGSTIDGPAQRAMLSLSGVGPRVRLAGRAIGNSVLLLGFQAAVAPVAIVLYAPDVAGWIWMPPMMLLVAAGLGTLGALADQISEGLAGRTLLGTLLVAPLTVPLLLGATGVLNAARHDNPPWPWLLLSLTVVLATVLLSAWCAHHLEEPL